MESSTKKSGDSFEITKKKRSLDLKSLYKSRVSAVAESKETVFKENDLQNVKKKKKRKSTKEVSLSSFESDAKRCRKEDVNAVKSELSFSQKLSGLLHGFSLDVGGNGNAFNFPKRPRGLGRRRKLVIHQAAKPLGLSNSSPNSVDCVGSFDDVLIKCENEVGPTDQLVRSVTPPAGNHGASNSKSAGKVVSNSKIKLKDSSKSTGKGSSSNAKLKQKAGANVVTENRNDGTSIQHIEKENVGRSNLEIKQTEDSKSTGKGSSSIVKLKLKVGANVLNEGRNDRTSIQHVEEENISGSNSKVKQKEDSKSTGKCSNSNAKLKWKAGAIALNGSRNDRTPIENPEEDYISGSNSKVKQKEDSKSTGKGSSSNAKLKRQGGANVPNESRNDMVSVQHVEEKNIGGSNSKVKQKEDPKSTSKGSTSNVKLKLKAVANVFSDSGNNRTSIQHVEEGKISGSNSKIKQKEDSKSTGKGNSSNAKTKRKAGTNALDESRIDRASIQHVEEENISGTNLKVKQKEVSKSTGKSSRSNAKLKLKAGANVPNENRNDRPSIQHVEEENNSGSSSKMMQKEDSKSTGTDSGLDAKLKWKGGAVVLNESGNDMTSIVHVEEENISGSNSKMKQKEDSKATGKSSGLNAKSKRKAGATVLTESRNDMPSIQRVEEETIGGTNSKVKQKEESKSTGKRSCSNSKLKRKAEANLLKGNRNGMASVQHVVEENISGSNSKVKQKEDSKSIGNGSSSNSKLKRKAEAKVLKESTNGRTSVQPVEEENNVAVNNGDKPSKKRRNNSGKKKDLLVGGDGGEDLKKSNALKGGTNDRKSIQHVEEENNVAVDIGDRPSKKRRSNSVKKIDLIVGGDGGKTSKKKSNVLKESTNDRIFLQHVEEENNVAVNDRPSKKHQSNSRKEKDSLVVGDGGEALKEKSEPFVISSISDSLLVDLDEDDEDEENLEQNAARMLSSRFDPSCTGFSSKRKSSVSQMVSEFSIPGSSSRDAFSRLANSSSGGDTGAADDKSRALRPRAEDKGKGVPRKRRHFYEILPGDLDPNWVLNRRIKVFWPLDESWYYGLVNDYHPECRLHHIKYDDRDEEWIDLHEEKFKLLLYPSEVPRQVKSKKVPPRNNDVHKRETVLPEGDDSSIGNCLDSEPIASWLARSSQRGKSLRTPSMSPVELPISSSLLSETAHNQNNNLADPKRTGSNQYFESTLCDKLVDHETVHKSFLGGLNCSRVVYARKKYQKKGEGSSSLSRDIKTHGSNSAAVTPLARGYVDSDKQLWSIDHRGLLWLNVRLVESKEFRFQICLPVLSFSAVPLVAGDFWMFHDILMLKHGLMSSTSRAVILEMLFVDSYLGLRFLLFEGCMRQALAFVFLILNVFSQPDEHMNSDMQSPITSIRLRLSSVQDPRKHHILELHSFFRLSCSKWVYLESKLLQYCVLIRELRVSECTYDNIKELEHGSLKHCKSSVESELPSSMDLNKKFVLGILPIGFSDEAFNTRIRQPALCFAAEPGKVPQFALSFSFAPTFFLTMHLQLLMGNNYCCNFNHHDALTNLHEESLSLASSPTSTTLPTSDSRSASRLGGMIIDIPSCGQVDTPLDRKRYISRQASDVGWNVNEDFIDSPNPTGSRCSGGQGSSISSPMGDLSPILLDRSPKFMRGGFSNGPRKRRTQVQYALPGAVYVSPKALPCKRIRRASLKRMMSDGSRDNQKNFELVACSANVLVTHGDKGWREFGALIVLEVADHNEWRLAIKLAGVTKYSYKVKHVLQPGTNNRFTHAVLWKGGKDWVLEFFDRSQWNLFKEMHEECYNRNIRAASVKNIPIPGVYLIEEIDDYGTEAPFVRNSVKYFRQVQTDVEMAMDPSHILYDMDSDDERWLMANQKFTDKSRCEDITEDFLEKIMDMFEKVAYMQHRYNFTDAEIEELVIGMGSAEAAKVIYQHWREKRGRKGMPLIRHLQPPLWQKYQRQLKEWEHSVAQGNLAVSAGNQEKVSIPEKPPMFAFCMKPRGLDIPNRGSKQRSHRKFPVSGHIHSVSGDHDSPLVSGRRSNGHTISDEKVLYTNSVYESSDASPPRQSSMKVLSSQKAHLTLRNAITKSSCSSKVYERKSKSRKRRSYTSSNDQQMISYKERTTENMNEVQQWNMVLPDLSNQRNYYFEGSQKQGVEQLNGTDLHQFQLHEALRAAEYTREIAKLKKERARKLSCVADLAIHKAARAVMTAEVVKAAHENSNGEQLRLSR